MNAGTPRPVTADMTARLRTEEGLLDLPATLTYTAADPYAVTLAFHADPDEPVTWCFAREMLWAGLCGSAGQNGADVRLWHTDDWTSLCIELSSPFGEATFEVPAGSIAEFLAETYQLVQAGSESRYVDVDAALAEFLRGAL